MIISHKYKFVFIKSRKTAGSTLEKILSRHLGENDILTGSKVDNTDSLNCELGGDGHAVPDIPKDYFSFSIERNPWDKVVSCYYWHKHSKPHIFESMTFEDYVFNCKMLPMDWSKYQGCDIVYKYEDMTEMYLDLKDRFNLGFDIDLIHTTKCKSNIRETKNYKELYTDKTKDHISKLFANEIERFDYVF